CWAEFPISSTGATTRASSCSAVRSSPPSDAPSTSAPPTTSEYADGLPARPGRSPGPGSFSCSMARRWRRRERPGGVDGILQDTAVDREEDVPQPTADIAERIGVVG